MTSVHGDVPSRWQQCATCGNRLDELDARTTCPQCGGLLDVMFHTPAGRAADLRRQFDSAVTITLGWAQDDGAMTVDELLARAEAALEWRKTARRRAAARPSLRGRRAERG